MSVDPNMHIHSGERKTEFSPPPPASIGEMQGVKVTAASQDNPVVSSDIKAKMVIPQPSQTQLASPVQKRQKAVEKGLTTVVRVQGTAETKCSLEERMKHYHVPNVSIAIINDGQLEWAAEYGAGAPKVFQIASISKSITALTILKIAQEKGLDLNAPVNTYLRSWKIEGEFADQVTIRGLLSHTAGINVPGFDGYPKGEALPTLIQILKGEKPCNSPPVQVATPPGSKWSYSGGGYEILQLLIEDVYNEGRADKKSFPNIVDELIFTPLNMRSSSYVPPANESVALGHLNNGTKVEGGYHIYPELASASIWSTSRDVGIFLIELQNISQGRGKIIKSSDLAKEMFEPAQGSPFGLGLEIEKEAGKPTRIGHGGHNLGYRTVMTGFAENGKGVVILTNGELGHYLMDEILGGVEGVYDWTPRKKPPILEAYPVENAQEVFKAYAGTYLVEGERKEKIVITLENGKLYSDNPVMPFRQELIPIGPRRFILAESGEEYQFDGNSLKSNFTDARITRVVSNP